MLAQVGISETIIENSFSQATLQRGIDYFESDRVEITLIESITGKDVTIHADVFGSLNYAYSIVVTIKVTKNHTSVIGECDCPVGFRCKHAVAALFEFSRLNAQAINEKGQLESLDSGRQAELDVEHWLNSLKSESSVNQNNVSSGSDSHKTKPAYTNVLLYLIQPTEDGQDMEIVTIVARRLKKGGFGKARAQSLEDMVDGYTAHLNFEHNEQDVEISGLLYSMTGRGIFYRQNTYALKGDIGELTLEKLLKTKRCFWQTQELNQPLQAGGSRFFEMKWHSVDDKYQIIANTSPEAQELFRLHNFYYIDTQTNQIGLVEHSDLNAQQVSQILNAPPVPQTMAMQVSEQLLQAWPENNVPMPADLNNKTIIIEEAPTADALMHSLELKNDQRRVHLLSLRFNYGGHLIQPEKNSRTYRFIKDEQQYQIVRDPQFEQECLLTLQQNHFVSIYEIASAEDRESLNRLDQTILSESASATLWHWHDFQFDTIPKLKEQGWQVEFDDSFSMQIEESDEWYGELEEKDNQEWFEISLGIELNGQNINLLPSLVELLASEKDPAQMRERIVLREHIILPVSEDEDNPRWVKLPSSRIMGIFDILIELYDKHALNDSGNLEFSKHQGLQLRELLNDPKLKWKGAEQLQILSKKIQNFKGIETIVAPEGLRTELRDYQQHGLNWLQFMREYQFNGILADDMGLGKTVQALAHLLYEKQLTEQQIDGDQALVLPSLVVAPTSLMGNWKREAKRFTPSLNVLLLHGPDRKELFAEVDQYDVILTTYALMLRDKELHSEQNYNFVILDESQNIKNARSKTSQVIFKLKAKHRLCMTGTPMENHLGELWSLFHFLMPGFLGTQDRFNRLFRSPIEKQGDTDRQQQLHQRIKPFMLRRTKEMVATELPEKTEMIRTIPLSGKQRDLYETVRLAMDEKVREEISKKGLARSQIMILDALLKLRQTCCDPRLLSLSSAKDVHESAKLEMLMEMVPEMAEEGRKIIIFSQFVKMLGFIEEELLKHKITYSKLTGQTRNRDEVIQSFQEGDAQVFLISLKAGGVGLNLTAADTVIHYDPWWNPAVERQATDRAYRIGQDKPVFVYKLLTEETVEEKILQMQKSKQQLADALYQDKKTAAVSDTGSTKKSPQFSQEELMDLLNPLGTS